MSVRINLSIAEDLKARMEATPESVNWSRIAAQAFEAELGRQEAEGWRAHAPELVAAVGSGGPEGLARVLEVVARTRPELAEAAERELGPLFQRFTGPDAALTGLTGSKDAGLLEAMRAVLKSYHGLVVEPMRNQMLAELVLHRLSKVARRHDRRAAFRGRARRRLRMRRDHGDCAPE